MNQINHEHLNSFLSTNGLNFEVEMRPQSITVPARDDEGNLVAGTEKQVVTSYCPVRTDTMQHLSRGGKSEDFHPIQNRDAFSIITSLSEVKDIDLVKGGMWGNGAGVFASVSLGAIQVGNASNSDYVGKHLTIVNSHDGTKALHVLITPYRFFCKNQIASTLAMAEEGVTMLSIKHNAKAKEKIEELLEYVQIADGVFKNTQELYQDLAQRPVSNDYVADVIAQMFPTPQPKQGEKEVTERTMNGWKKKVNSTLERFKKADGLRDHFIDIQDDKNVFNAWNLYNAVQGTIQHDARNTASKQKSVIMGPIAKKSKEALDVVNQLTAPDAISTSVQNEIDALIGESLFA